MSHGGKWAIMRDISFSHPERVVPNIFCIFFISSITLYSQLIPSAIFIQLLSSLGFMERMIVLAAYIHANLISISVQSLARVVSNVLHDQHLNLSHSTSTYLYNTLVPGARNVTHSLTHWHTTFYMFWFLKLLKLFDNILKSCFVRWSNLCESFEKLSCISNWCHFP